MRKRPTAAQQRKLVEAFNAENGIGARVRYWSGIREGPGVLSRTRTQAQMLVSHTAVVWVEGYAACISLSHVQREKEEA